MTLFERIHEVIKKHFDDFEHRGEQITPPDPEGLANAVIAAHAEHVAENHDVRAEPEQPEKTDEVAK